MKLSPYTIYNARTLERKVVRATSYREAFKMTGWDEDKRWCVMVPWLDPYLEQKPIFAERIMKAMERTGSS